MLSSVKGFISRSTNHVMTGLSGHLMSRVAGPVPRGLDEILSLCHHSRTPEEISSLAGRIEILSKEPQNLAIRKTLESWYTQIQAASADTIPQLLQKIQTEAEQVILYQTPMIGHISTQLGQIINQALKTAPVHIIEAKRQIYYKNHSLPFDKEALKYHLTACMEKESWSEPQMERLQAAIRCLSTEEGLLDWQNLHSLILEKELELSGSLVQSSDNVRIKTQQLLSDCLTTVGSGLFKQADPARTKLEKCMSLLRHLLESSKLELPQPILFENLEHLVIFLDDIFKDDVNFQRALEEFQELLVEKNSFEIAPEQYYQRIYLTLKKFLPYFEPSGVAVQLYETTTALFLRNAQSSRKGMNPLLIPYNFSQSNLNELQSSPRGVTPKLLRGRLSIEFEPQDPPEAVLTAPLPNLTDEIQSFLCENKTSIFLNFVGKMGIIAENFSIKDKSFETTMKEVSQNFVEGSLRILPPLKEALAKRFDTVYEALSLRICTKWVPTILEALRGIDNLEKDTVNPVPLKRIVKTLNQLSKDLESYSLSKSVLMREDYLKSKRFETRISLKQSFKEGWRIGKILTDLVLDDIKLENFVSIGFQKKPTNPVLSLISDFIDMGLVITNWILRKIFWVVLRVSLSVVPYYMITEKILDHIFTTQRLQKMYRSLLDTVLEDFRQGEKGLLNLELGGRVDSKISKELLKSMLDIIPKNEGNDLSGLKENLFMLLPSFARGIFYDKATAGVSMIWENMVHPETIKKIETGCVALLRRISSTSPTWCRDLPQPLSLPIQDIEHALSSYVTKEVLTYNPKDHIDQRFQYITGQILALPEFDQNHAYFQHMFKKLLKEVMDSCQQKNPTVFGSNYHRILGHMHEIHLLLETMQNPTEKIREFQQDVSFLRPEYPPEFERMNFGDEAIAFGINLGFMQVREWLTDKEFIKRIVLDQLLPT
ncbi:MAG: hypothetical protein FJZ62_00925 [Chlamydiae bacterium]|nr:hypothetical protein [Chlamydiota bacterium]